MSTKHHEETEKGKGKQDFRHSVWYVLFAKTITLEHFEKLRHCVLREKETDRPAIQIQKITRPIEATSTRIRFHSVFILFQVMAIVFYSLEDGEQYKNARKTYTCGWGLSRDFWNFWNYEYYEYYEISENIYISEICWWCVATCITVLSCTYFCRCLQGSIIKCPIL